MSWFTSAFGLNRNRRPDSDGALLSRYVDGHDDGAFAVLVERHTPMVYRVCRGVLRDEHDAEDAAQATFLALARQAAAVRKRESLASWLHGTALRTASGVRTRRARDERRARESAQPEERRSDALGELTVREAREILHAELDRLPDHYKAPLVLVYLEGQSHEDAAAALGWSQTAFRGRLERARKALAARLAQHKLTLVAVFALTALTLDPPPGLAAGIALAVGPAGYEAPVGVKFPLAAKGGLAAAAAVAGVAGAVTFGPFGGPGAALTAPAAVAPVVEPGWYYHTGQVVAVTEEGFFWLHPTGGAALKLADAYPHPVTRFRMSPDGRAVAFEAAAPRGKHAVTRRFDGDRATFNVRPEPADSFFWTRDSKLVVMTDPRGGTTAYTPDSGVSWNAPAGYTLLDATANETTLLAVNPDGTELSLIDQSAAPAWDRAGRPARLFGGLTRETARTWRLSPDGRSAAGQRADGRVAVFDIQTRSESVIPDSDGANFLAWAPDSRAVLVARGGGVGGFAALVAHRLDGAPPRVLTPPPGKRILWADWR